MLRQEKEVEVVTITGNAEGKLYAQHQVQDYALRGTEYESMGFLSFTVETYERRITSEEIEEIGNRNGTDQHTNHPSHYLANHPKTSSHYRVLQADHHNSLPNIVGPWFPRRDGEEATKPYYYASMLALLKPWRDLHLLKADDERWETAFATFLENASQRDRDVVACCQYYYESRSVSANRNVDEERDLDIYDDREDENNVEINIDESANFTVKKIIIKL